jgi:hypothetical protein
MLNKLKNWWFVILSAIIALLDAGFDLINPALELLNLSDGTLNTIKFLFLIGTIIKTKLEAPTQNPQKLINLAHKKAEQQGDPIPPAGPKG